MEQGKRRHEIVEEYLRGGVSLRELSRRYGMNHTAIHRWVKAYERGEGVEKRRPEAIKQMPRDVARLQRELYEARLEAKLYRTMIEVAEREFGVPIRKKPGAR